MEQAERTKRKILAFIGRSGCHACDRAEAGYQLKTLNDKIAILTKNLQTYGNNPKG